jgi:site-specific recombinase XerD
MNISIKSPVKSGVRVCDGPLTAHIATYRAKLEALGYSAEMVLYHLRLFAKFDLWLVRRKRRLRLLDENDADRFLEQCRAKHPYACRGARSSLPLIFEILRDAGVVAPASKPTTHHPAERLANEYRRFLQGERGLDDATVGNYSRHVDRFLAEHFGAGRVNLRFLGAREVNAFVRRHAPRNGRGWAAQMVTGLRSFFRFAHYRGLITSDLAATVPAVPNWTASGLPKHLPADAIERVLSVCERSTVRGKRDYAILLLLARLGLRAGEVVALQLEDINWALAEITVRSKKGEGWAKLPLPADVGRALARYLAVRPQSVHRNVFVRDYAPYTPFAVSGPVSVLARKAIERAGVKSTRTGAHVFRHSLATEMLRLGASLDQIGRVLRHRHPDSTAIYAKVDLTALRGLALPWPGGAQ